MNLLHGLLQKGAAQIERHLANAEAIRRGAARRLFHGLRSTTGPAARGGAALCGPGRRGGARVFSDACWRSSPPFRSRPGFAFPARRRAASRSVSLGHPRVTPVCAESAALARVSPQSRNPARVPDDQPHPPPFCSILQLRVTYSPLQAARQKKGKKSGRPTRPVSSRIRRINVEIVRGGALPTSR